MADDSGLRARADARFEQALRAAGARDPRDFYREQLKALRDDPSAFRRALAYFEEHLIPTVAADGSDPIGEWLEYGRVLAELTVPGRAVQVDPSGRARSYARPMAPDALVLHLPDDPTRPALIVGIPPSLSPAQRATHELLVKQAHG